MVIYFNLNIRQFILVCRICTSRVTESGGSLVIDFTFNIRQFLLVRRICTIRGTDRYCTLNVSRLILNTTLLNIYQHIRFINKGLSIFQKVNV